MNIGFVYYSFSGRTRSVVEKLQTNLGGDLIEVTSLPPYSTLSAVTKGCYRALKGTSDMISPERIDTTGYDLVVLASPVWAGRQTPAMNAAVSAVLKPEGTPVFLILTSGDKTSGEQAMNIFTGMVSEKGMQVCGTVVLDKNETMNQAAIAAIIPMIQAAEGTR
jgi:flavodoxin